MNVIDNTRRCHTMTQETERCPRCDGPMERVTIDGHDSWACPVDAYAYAVDEPDWDDYHE
jgi:uncharacterized protein with PIN domain